jgi:tetratricopeptide (TPR) repeat protein
MKKILLLILLFSSSVFGDTEDRRNKVLRIIDSEIAEITRVVKATRGSNPTFVLRLAELYYEQAKLIRERETNKFMELSEADRRTANKASYFTESKGFFEKAQKTAEFLVKKYPGYKDKAEAYYILAKNAMEFQDKKSAEKYFKIAHNTSGGNIELQEKTGLSVAENLYNDKKYAQAIPYYEKSLTNKSDKWWTKDAYNLAWCYYRSKQAAKAINLMREVHRLSKSGNYIDVAPQVEKDLAFLYTVEGRKDEAVAFFREQKVDIPSKFLAVAKWLEETGKALQAEQLLDVALNLNPTDQQEAEIYSALLDIYEKYGKVEKHLNACKKLAEFSKKGKISSETLETLHYQAERVGAIMQKQVASIAYKHSPETRKRKALIAVEYYNLLLEIDPKNNDKWNFYAAESLFAAGLYSQAIPYYYNGNKAAKDKNNKEFINLTSVGLLASLDKPSVSESLKDQYTMTAYKLSLENDSKSEKASKIYQRIFKYYISKKMMADAEKTLMEFNENFPNESGIIEAMIAQIIDYYKRVKNYPEVERWAKRVASGEFKVSSNYTGQVRLTFVSTKLEKVEKATNKTEAINGYSEIYSNQVASRDARANAAYNISIIYFEMENSDYAYQWIEKAFSLMDLKTKQKYASSFQAMGKDFLGRRQFDRALNIYEKILEATCATKASLNEDIFGEMAYIEISEKNYSNAFNRMEKYKRCGINQNSYNSLRADLLDDLIGAEQIGKFNEYFRIYQNDISMTSILIKSLGDLMTFYLKEGLLDKADEIKRDIYNLYERGKKAKHNFSGDARDVYAGLELETLKREINRMNAITLTFPEKVFQKSFQEKYNLMVSINKIFNKITSLGSNQANVAAFRYMVSAYRSFINSVNQVNPTGDQNYINSFRKTLSGVTGPYARQATDLESKGRSIIETGDILSKDNFFFINTPNIVGDYEYAKSGVLMDKGGGR